MRNKKDEIIWLERQDCITLHEDSEQEHRKRQKLIYRDAEQGDLLQKVGFSFTSSRAGYTMAELLQDVLRQENEMTGVDDMWSDCLPKDKDAMEACVMEFLIGNSFRAIYNWMTKAVPGDTLECSAALTMGSIYGNEQEYLLHRGVRRSSMTGLIREYESDRITLLLERTDESETYPHGFIVKEAYPDWELVDALPTGRDLQGDMRKTEEFQNASPVRKAYLEYIADAKVDPRLKPVFYSDGTDIYAEMAEDRDGEFLWMKLEDPYDIGKTHNIEIDGRFFGHNHELYEIYPDEMWLMERLGNRIEAHKAGRTFANADEGSEAYEAEEVLSLRQILHGYQARQGKDQWVPVGGSVSYNNEDETDPMTGEIRNLEYLSMKIGYLPLHEVRISAHGTTVHSYENCDGIIVDIVSPFKVEGSFRDEDADLSCPANRRKFALKYPDIMKQVEYLEEQIERQRKIGSRHDREEDENRIFPSYMETESIHTVAVPENMILDMIYYLDRDAKWYRVYSWTDILNGAAPVDWQDAGAMLQENFPEETVPAIFETHIPVDTIIPQIRRICQADAKDPLLDSRKTMDRSLKTKLNRVLECKQKREEIETKYDRWDICEIQDDGQWITDFVMFYDESITEDEMLEVLSSVKFRISSSEAYSWQEDEYELQTICIVKASSSIWCGDGNMNGFRYDGYTAALNPVTGCIVPESFRMEAQNAWQNQTSQSNLGERIFRQAAKHVDAIMAYSKQADMEFGESSYGLSTGLMTLL